MFEHMGQTEPMNQMILWKESEMEKKDYCKDAGSVASSDSGSVASSDSGSVASSDSRSVASSDSGSVASSDSGSVVSSDSGSVAAAGFCRNCCHASVWSLFMMFRK